MEGCPFCNLSEDDKKWQLYADPWWTVFLADVQDYAGRCLVVCNRHRESVRELCAEEWLDLKTVMDALERMLAAELGATMFNWSCLLNDAYKADPPHPHLHFHLRPRYRQPLSIADLVYVDHEFAHHYDNHAPVQLVERSAQALYERLEAVVGQYFPR